MCMGAIIYMLKVGRPSVAIRFAIHAGMVDLGDIVSQNDSIIEPLPRK